MEPLSSARQVSPGHPSFPSRYVRLLESARLRTRLGDTLAHSELSRLQASFSSLWVQFITWFPFSCHFLALVRFFLHSAADSSLPVSPGAHGGEPQGQQLRTADGA